MLTHLQTLRRCLEASTPRDFNNHLAQMKKARQEPLGQQQQQQQSNEQENDGNGGMTLTQAESVTKPE